MHNQYYDKDGNEIFAGATIASPAGVMFTITDLYSSEVYATKIVNSYSAYHSLTALGITIKRTPYYWIMNRETRMPVAVGDKLDGSAIDRVDPVLEDGCSVRRAGYRYRLTNGTAHSTGYEIHNRTPDTPHPVMPESRIVDGNLELLIDGDWIPSYNLYMTSAGVRYNACTHKEFEGAALPLSEFRRCGNGNMYHKSITTKIGKKYYMSSLCCQIDGKQYLKKDCFYLHDEGEWVLELPDDYVPVHNTDGYLPVDDCIHCEHEDVWVESDDAHEFNDEYYTGQWISDNTFECNSCGERFSNSDYECCGCCSDCGCPDRDDNDERVKDYSNRSANKLKPERDVPIKFGIELEVEAARSLSDSLDAFDAALPSGYCVYKEDGSLEDGFEVVTRPDCPSVHKRIFADALSRKSIRETTTSWKSGRCGIHIHVSRAPLSDLWVGRVAVLVHSSRMAKVVAAVAGRYNKSYCVIDGRKKLTSGKKEAYCGRYDALNTGADNTIEFRIFRGTLHRESFLKNIEFVEAALAFCKPSVSSNSDVDNPDAFLSFVRKGRKSYSYLFEFLRGKGYYGDHPAPPTAEEVAARKATAAKRREEGRVRLDALLVTHP
jgi:predicted  nucleic acid-binding Zn-ribbon protein